MHATRRDVQVDAADDRLLAVREPDLVEVEPALDPRRAARVRAVLDLGLGVEDGRDLLHRRARRLHLAVEVRELLQRLEHELEQEDGRDQRADRERPVVVQRAPPTSSTAAIATMPKTSIAGKKSELSYCAYVFVPPVRVVQLVELGLERPLAVERLDHGHARRPTPRSARSSPRSCSAPRGTRVRAHLEPARQHERRRQDRRARRARAASPG